MQVLDATEARGRCFERLFVIGLARDAFPRSPREDPLLPDGLREQVRVLLPEVPIKKLGLDEERFLFAELLASAPRVTLSWPLASEDGRPCARSGFVERLRWGGVFEGPSAREARGSLRLRTARCRTWPSQEHCCARPSRPAGAPRRGPAPALRGIAGELLALGPDFEADAIAEARLAVLREMEGEFQRALPLGPYFGFVGTQRSARDPRAAPLHVTTLERLARCGWQTLLERLLRLEAPPDAGGALPGIDNRLLGSEVHQRSTSSFRDPRRGLDRGCRAGQGRGPGRGQGARGGRRSAR